MNGRMRIFAAALLLSAAAAGLWRWQGVRKAVALERHNAWVDYLQGPLSDLLYGSSRLRPLLMKKALNKAEVAEGREAAEHLERSANDAVRYQAAFAKDPVLGPPFDAAAQYHRLIQERMAPWEKALGAAGAKELIHAEAELRLRLWKDLKAGAAQVLKEKILNRDEALEMNALLYSLQEETGTAEKESH